MNCNETVKTFISLVPSVFAAQPNPGCDLSQYKPSPGLSAAERAGISRSRMDRRTANNCAPVHQCATDSRGAELAARKAAEVDRAGAGTCAGVRNHQRASALLEAADAPLKELGIALTPEVVEREKWNAFGTRR